MQELTFGEQVKIILSRKGMTIKELAERVEAHTGKPMSRQNMTQKLHRDNFQEQDMRMLAEILGCKFVLNIMEEAEQPVEAQVVEPQPTTQSAEPQPTQQPQPATTQPAEPKPTTPQPIEPQPTTPQPIEPQPAEEQLVGENPLEREVTVGELLDMQEPEQKFKGFVGFRKGKVKEKESEETKQEQSEEQDVSEPEEILGDINPYTGKEYASNSVRMHPKRIGYVQVYDQTEHKWTDMTEWAFLGFQERKKALLGKDYEPPIYLD